MSEYIAIRIGRWQRNHVPLAWSYDLKITACQQTEDSDIWHNLQLLQFNNQILVERDCMQCMVKVPATESINLSWI